jgi:Tfp pilus assembly protein PilF
MQLGPMADEEIRAAMAAAPGNPRVLILQGISQLYTPQEYGGGADKAEATLRAAVAAVAADAPPAPYPNWGHAEAYAWLGVVYTQQGKRDLAREALTKSLSIDPEYVWVSKSLLPAVSKPPQ